MNRKRVKGEIWFSLLTCILFSLIVPTPSTRGDSAPGSSPSAQQIKAEPKITVAPESASLPIRQEVKILRKERRKKMPYLDRRYIKDTIDAKTVKAKQAFTQQGNKGLNEVVTRAMEVYTPARAAKEKITLAKRRVMVAARELLPEGSFNFEIRNGSLSADAFKGSDYHVAFRLPIFRGGVLWNTFLKDRAELRAARKDYEGMVNEVVDEVAKAFFEYHRAREVLSDKQRILEEAQQKLDISRKKYKQALISEIEYLNVEAIAGQMEYDIETAEQELEIAKLELQRYLDLDVGDEIEIQHLYDADALIEKASKKPAAEGENSRKGLSQTLDEFIDMAYRYHPELQEEAEKLRAARLEELVGRGAFLGRADLLMEFGELGEAFTRNLDNPVHFPEWHLGLEVSNNFFGNKVKYTFDNDENAPSVAQFLQGTGSQITRRKLEFGFLDGLKDYVELQEARVKRLEQVIELEKKEREVVRQVKEAYFEYHKSQVQVESSLKRNQYRQRLVKLDQLRLEKAEIEISEFLQSLSLQAEERANLHKALADFSKAKSKLNRAIGIRGFLPVEEKYGL